jgi:hypothetical protein
MKVSVLEEPEIAMFWGIRVVSRSNFASVEFSSIGVFLFLK